MSSTPTTISFRAKPYMIKDWLVLNVPLEESQKLPSRGQVSVVGTINDHKLTAVLEPDGRHGHWLRMTDELQKMAGVRAGSDAIVELTVSKEWPEPTIPKDVADALKIAPQKVQEKWQSITPMARWEWIRWMNATLSQETRAVRIEKTISKLNGKHRRPCCFNLAACTEPYVAKNGQLLEVS